MSVSTDIISKSLAPALGLDDSTVEAWVSTVWHRAVEELMLSGNVQLSGIGVLKKSHIPSEPHDFGDGKLGLMPPHARVELLPIESDDSGFIYDVALSDLKLDEDAADKFAKGFARVVEKVLEAKGSLAIGRLGALIRTESGAASFQESTWLNELLNKPYKHLSPVLISGDDDGVERNLRGKEITPVAFKPSDFGLDSPPPKKQEVKTDEFAFSAPKFSAPEKKDDSKQEQEKKRERFQPPVPTFESAKSDVGQSAEPQYESIYKFQVPPPQKQETSPDLDNLLADSSSPDTTKRLLTIGGSTLAAVAFVVVLFFFLNQLGQEKNVTPQTDAPKTQRKTTDTSVEKESEQALPEPAKVEMTKVEQPKQTEKQPSAPSETKPSDAKTSEPKPDSKAEIKSQIKPEPPKPIENTGLPAELITPVNESKGGWTIVVASRPTENEAKTIAADYAKKGFATTIKARLVNGETRYRVRVGQFEKQNDALKTIKQQSARLPQGAFLDKVQ